MEPKQKAKELVESFWFIIPEAGNNIVKPSTGNIDWVFDEKGHKECCKKCALKALDLIIEETYLLRLPLKYWEQVKTEINLL